MDTYAYSKILKLCNVQLKGDISCFKTNKQIKLCFYVHLLLNLPHESPSKWSFFKWFICCEKMLTPGQCKNKYQKRASKRECVTYWLQGNSAKHLITAVPGNLNLSKKIQCSRCLIAVDGCWSVMHDNMCVTLLPAYVHSCQPSLQVMRTAPLTTVEREKKIEHSQPQSNMYPNNPSHGNRAPKMDRKGQFLSTILPFFIYAKKKIKKIKKCVASVTDSIPTGKIQVSCLLDYMFEHMLGAAWSNLNYNWVAMNIIIFGELEL